jgi:phosphoglycolate phosphatase
MRQHTIFLFDIDGTLVTTDGAGRRAITRALATLNIAGDAVDFSFAGMTDPYIFGQAFARADRPELAWETLLECYLNFMKEELAVAVNYRVHTGVEVLLKRLSTLTDIAMGLGTGNVERGARIKLERGQLNQYFSFGGYGCDSGNRGELLRAGALRGAKELGRPLDQCRVWVIGDTPRDVAAAKTIGAQCVAVATGGATHDELKDAAPELVCDDLTEPEVWQVLSGA